MQIASVMHNIIPLSVTRLPVAYFSTPSHKKGTIFWENDFSDMKCVF